MLTTHMYLLAAAQNSPYGLDDTDYVTVRLANGNMYLTYISISKLHRLPMLKQQDMLKEICICTCYTRMEHSIWTNGIVQAWSVLNDCEI